MHTKVERKKPLVIYLIPVVILIILGLVYFEYNKFKNKNKPVSDVSTVEKNKDVSLGVNSAAGGGAGRGAQATHHDTPPAAVGLPPNLQDSTKIIVLDMPKLFRTWSQKGIDDDDLKFLPVSMCAVSSAKTVKCKIPANSPFKNYFTNYSCTPDFCFGFFSRIIVNEDNQRNFTTTAPTPIPATTPPVAAN